MASYWWLVDSERTNPRNHQSPTTIKTATGE
jgi:hypothetical protein